MKNEPLEETIVRVVSEHRDPKSTIQAIRRLHPKASKKQIIRAAFSVMIERSETDADASRDLQSFAISNRSGQDT
jgi:hypothetical protein